MRRADAGPAGVRPGARSPISGIARRPRPPGHPGVPRFRAWDHACVALSGSATRRREECSDDRFAAPGPRPDEEVSRSRQWVPWWSRCSRMMGLDRPAGGGGGHHHLPRGGPGGVEPDHRPGDDPGGGPGDRRHAAVRHQQQGAGRRSPRRRPAGRSRAPGCRAPTPRRSSTARSRRPTTPAATRLSTFSATTKSTLTLLAYDGTAADPVAAFASAAETVNRADAHAPPAPTSATAGSYVVSYWADKSASDDHRLDPARPARPSAASRSAPAPAASPPSPPTRTRPSAPARPPARTATSAVSTRQGDHVDRRAPGRPDRRTRTWPRWRRSP